MTRPKFPAVAVAWLLTACVAAASLAVGKATGAVAGKTVDAAGRANESVKVTAFDGDKELGSGYSDSDGKFTIADLPAGRGYTLVAVRKLRAMSMSGKKTDVTVKAGQTTAVGNIEIGMGEPG